MPTEGINEARAHILAAEYIALRAELMFFIQMQRQNMNFLLTTAFGQIVGLAFVGYEKVDPVLIIYFYLLAVPFLIAVLMLMSFENTAKIVIVASYISDNLRRQIRPLFDTDLDYFQWEHHKNETRRINRRVMVVLDRSKWLVFVIGLFLSTSLAYLTQKKTHGLTSGLIFLRPWKLSVFGHTIELYDQFIIGFVIVILIIFAAFRAASYFSEAEGEEAHRLQPAARELQAASALPSQGSDVAQTPPPQSPGATPVGERISP